MDTPLFPIRILFDDGDSLELESPEDLLDRVDTLDSNDPRIWVRDALDRNVALLVRYGTVERFEVL
jgi:hypothetical protein